MSEKIFVNGLILKRPKPTAPKWVLWNISIKADELINFITEHQKNGWVNIDVKESKEGNKIYCELNTFVPVKDKVKEESDNQEELNNLSTDLKDGDEINANDIPF